MKYVYMGLPEIELTRTYALQIYTTLNSMSNYVEVDEKKHLDKDKWGPD